MAEQHELHEASRHSATNSPRKENGVAAESPATKQRPDSAKKVSFGEKQQREAASAEKKEAAAAATTTGVADPTAPASATTTATTTSAGSLTSSITLPTSARKESNKLTMSGNAANSAHAAVANTANTANASGTANTTNTGPAASTAHAAQASASTAPTTTAATTTVAALATSITAAPPSSAPPSAATATAAATAATIATATATATANPTPFLLVSSGSSRREKESAEGGGSGGSGGVGGGASGGSGSANASKPLSRPASATATRGVPSPAVSARSTIERPSSAGPSTSAAAASATAAASGAAAAAKLKRPSSATTRVVVPSPAGAAKPTRGSATPPPAAPPPRRTNYGKKKHTAIGLIHLWDCLRLMLDPNLDPLPPEEPVEDDKDKQRKRPGNEDQVESMDTLAMIRLRDEMKRTHRSIHKELMDFRRSLKHLYGDHDKLLKQQESIKGLRQTVTNVQMEYDLEVKKQHESFNDMQRELAMCHKEQRELDASLARIKETNLMMNVRIEEVRKQAESQQGPTGKVTFVCVKVGTTSTQRELQASLEVYNAQLMEKTKELGGFVAKSEARTHLIAFASPIDAVWLTLKLQEDLVVAEWPPELFQIVDAREQTSNGKLLYRGLKVKIGVYTGEPICEPDPVTLRMNYFGPTVKRTVIIASSAAPGQTVLNGSTWELVKDHLMRLGSPMPLELGSFRFKSMDTREFLVQLLPVSLQDRVFAPPTYAQPPDPELDALAPVGKVAFVFCRIQGITNLHNKLKPSTMSRVIHTFNEVVSVRTQEMRAYEVATGDDWLLLSFQSTFTAAEWALKVQDELVRAAWPAELESAADTEVQYNSRGKMLFRGLRVGMSCHTDHPSSEIDPVTNTVCYYGPGVKQAVDIGRAAAGGQILVSVPSWQELGDQIPKLAYPTHMELRYHQQIGLDRPVVQLLPASLSERIFALTRPQHHAAKEVRHKLQGLKVQNADMLESLTDVQLTLAQVYDLTNMLNERLRQIKRGMARSLDQTTVDPALVQAFGEIDALAHEQQTLTGTLRSLEGVRDLIDARVSEVEAVLKNSEEVNSSQREMELHILELKKRLQDEQHVRLRFGLPCSEDFQIHLDELARSGLGVAFFEGGQRVVLKKWKNSRDRISHNIGFTPPGSYSLSKKGSPAGTASAAAAAKARVDPVELFEHDEG